MNETHSPNIHSSVLLKEAGLDSKYRTIPAGIRYLVALAAVSLSLACAGGGASGDVTAPPATLAFSLQQVNGQILPATFQTSDGLLVIGSGTMKLTPEKNFAEMIIFNFTPTGGTAAADTSITNGTYAQTGSSIVFTVPATATDPALTFSGTVSGNTLTYNDQGFVTVYSR